MERLQPRFLLKNLIQAVQPPITDASSTVSQALRTQRPGVICRSGMARGTAASRFYRWRRRGSDTPLAAVQQQANHAASSTGTSMTWMALSSGRTKACRRRTHTGIRRQSARAQSAASARKSTSGLKGMALDVGLDAGNGMRLCLPT